LAVQVYSMIGLLRNGERPRRDVVFCGVVEEEIGGTGAKYWVKNLDYPVALVVLGEPSSNRLSLGHRGIEGYWVQFNGRAAHASAPSRGENPNYYLATFLQRLVERQGELKSHPYLGGTTVSPTVMEVDTTSTNVIPAWARVFLDFRTAAESPASLIAFVEALAHDLPHVILPGHTWSDMSSAEPLVGFATPPESEPVQRVLAALRHGTGRDVPTFSYQFATDGRFFPAYGLQVLGYAPGAEELAHTADEYIPIAEMMEALQGYMQILREY
jgi:acetylornithine deacetylase/succinyl-diaminopimelate desuccinylase-like protein